MIIKLSPISPLSRDVTLQVSKSGDALTINNAVFDFSKLGAGSTLPAEAIGCDAIQAPVYRDGEELVVQLVLPCWPDSPDSALFPVDIFHPVDGPIQFPGLEMLDQQTPAIGIIDWSQEVTAEAKAKAAAEQELTEAVAEVARRRAIADAAIAPLQDAVDLGDSTESEAALLTEWRRYRVALNRLADQEGYPASIDWPAPPA
ncbi:MULTISPECIES: tail fiber assembly protein [unclassified Pseudomonas]|uniref:tail fiber assembly protein n=1 Tax=unclassified Pseudomonas TaxID=196821 RepID=UPI0027B8A1DE|nr:MULTISPECIES: tail fiber assembly protein [unclassified Pseudomonas]